MKTPAVVSIMMPAYNAEKYIGLAIESVLSQSYSNWELIIVNDGSTDSTLEIAASYSDPRIKVFNQPNGGESSARNTSLTHMQGDLVAFLDADDLYLPNHLDVTVSYLQTHTDVDGVYTDGYYCDQSGARLKTLSSRRRGPFNGDIFEEVIRSSDVFGAPVCVVLRRNLIAQFGLKFDPAIVIGPDWDFLSLYAEVAKFGHLGYHTCLYRVHQTNISIRTTLQQRALYLARCREKAIKMRRFNACSVETRTFVFYDLLINLLGGLPERQAATTQWTEFTDLPIENRAKLLRLMASRSILRSGEHLWIIEWLRLSQELNPKDFRGKVLNILYNLNPHFCKFLLSIKTSSQPDLINASPFSDLV